ncbi:hypothetical protein HDU83_001313 [Entophlyctis luteolus]|nr:hypothetical protein HDU83_001313 [Entophlyctis luteolus]
MTLNVGLDASSILQSLVESHIAQRDFGRFIQLVSATNALRKIPSFQVLDTEAHSLFSELCNSITSFTADCMAQISTGNVGASHHVLDVQRVKTALLQLCRNSADKEQANQILESVKWEQLVFLAPSAIFRPIGLIKWGVMDLDHSLCA